MDWRQRRRRQGLGDNDRGCGVTITGLKKLAKNDEGVGRGIWDRWLDSNNRGIGRGSRRYDVPKRTSCMAEAVVCLGPDNWWQRWWCHRRNTVPRTQRRQRRHWRRTRNRRRVQGIGYNGGGGGGLEIGLRNLRQQQRRRKRKMTTKTLTATT